MLSNSNRTIMLPSGACNEWQNVMAGRHPIRSGIHRFSFQIDQFRYGLLFGAVIQEWTGWNPTEEHDFRAYPGDGNLGKQNGIETLRVVLTFPNL